LQVRTINKFDNDKILFKDEEFIILTEGVIFNINKLQNEYKVSSLSDLCKEMYRRDGETFFKKFKGSFSGLFFDKIRDILLVFTDHIGDKSLFYSQSADNNIFFGSEIYYIIEQYKRNNYDYSLDFAGAYGLISYGYMLGDLTYIKEIRRLTAGHYLRISNNAFSVHKYHSFDYLPNYDLSDNEIIESIDSLFSQAVALQVEKNKEYGYNNIAALSAGLDTRMTTFAINRIVERSITNFTYSPVGFHDETISKQIIKDLKNNYIYQANESGIALLLIDESIETNEGLMAYYGAAVLVDFFDLINVHNIGVIHTGQLGDGVVGSITKKNKKKNNINRKMDAFSLRYIDKFHDYFDFDKYIRQFKFSEIFSIYNRGFT
ncbi:hypothetical protein LCGC14_2949090, partial [marine sediment metagenome]